MGEIRRGVQRISWAGRVEDLINAQGPARGGGGGEFEDGEAAGVGAAEGGGGEGLGERGVDLGGGGVDAGEAKVEAEGVLAGGVEGPLVLREVDAGDIEFQAAGAIWAGGGGDAEAVGVVLEVVGMAEGGGADFAQGDGAVAPGDGGAEAVDEAEGAVGGG